MAGTGDEEGLNYGTFVFRTNEKIFLENVNLDSTKVS